MNESNKQASGGRCIDGNRFAPKQSAIATECDADAAGTATVYGR
jgi:hypothetical protein